MRRYTFLKKQKPHKIKFLIDECVLNKTKQILEELGFSTISLKELGKMSASNGEVLNSAKNHKAVLITNDLDFANLALYPVGSHRGIIVLRPRSETPQTIEKVNQTLKRFLKKVPPSKIEKSLIIIDHNKYRIKTK